MKRGRHTLRTPPHNLNRKHIGPRQQSESCSTCKDAELSATTEKHRHSQVVGCVFRVDPRKGPDSGVRPSYKVIPKYPFPRLPSAKSSAGASWYRSSSSAPSLLKSELSIVRRSSSAVTRPPSIYRFLRRSSKGLWVGHIRCCQQVPSMSPHSLWSAA